MLRKRNSKFSSIKFEPKLASGCSRSAPELQNLEFYLKAGSHTSAILTTTGLHAITTIVTETELLMSILANVDAKNAGERFPDRRTDR